MARPNHRRCGRLLSEGHRTSLYSLSVIPAKAGIRFSSTWVAADVDPGLPPELRSLAASSVHQPVELRGVLAGDLVHGLGREAGELLLDILRAFRPDAVRVWVVGAPHQGFNPHLLDQLRPDAVELECRAALATPVFRRLQLHQIAETVLELEIHPVERIGQPADPALAKTDPQVRIALQHAGADDRGDDVDQVHLEAG